MLQYAGRSTCPRCLVPLVSQVNEVPLPTGESEDVDRYLVCPTCGFAKPIVYRVQRDPNIAA